MHNAKTIKQKTKGGYLYAVTNTYIANLGAPKKYYTGYVIDEKGRELQTRWYYNGKNIANPEFDFLPEN